ncbi:MAG: PKD domain-containing protein, partial [Planctomycetaceae bacterium]
MSVLIGTQNVNFDDTLATGGNFANFVELSAGPDLVVNEGDPVSLTASVRRPGFAFPVANVFPEGAGPGASNPSGFTEFNGKLYFAADDGMVGRELFVYDPANTQTTLAVDVRSGAVGSSPDELTVFNGKLYFVADNGVAGQELFEYDGSIATLIDLTVGASGSFLGDLVEFNGDLHFTAFTVANGQELYRLNGGTLTLAADIDAGAGSSEPQSLTVFNGDLYFSANVSGTGTELYRYDGTTATLAVDIDTGSGSSSPTDMTVFGSSLFFAGTDPSIGRELFEWNGSTLTAHDVDSGSGAGPFESNPTELTVAGGELYFAAGSQNGFVNREIYRFNGGSPQRIEVNTLTNTGSDPAWLTELNGDLYFSATDENFDVELWRVRGVTPQRVASISLLGSSAPSDLAAFNAELVLAADDGVTNREPWRFIPTENVTYDWQISGSPVGSPAGAMTPNFGFVPGNQGRFTADVTIRVPQTPLEFTDTVDVFTRAVVPTIDAGMDQTIGEGTTFTRSLMISDPGTDTWMVTVDYDNDGMAEDSFSTTDRNFNLSHLYSQPGVYPVTVTVTESSEGMAIDQFNVTVSNILPQVTLTPGAAVDEGATSTLTIDITDVTGEFGNYSLQQINWGDGVDGGTDVIENFSLNITSPTTAQAILTHTYADNRTGNAAYPVMVTVRGDDHGQPDAMQQPIDDESMASSSLTVNNLAPVIDLGMTSVPVSLFENQL